MGISRLKPLYQYFETGKPWPLPFYLVHVVAAVMSLFALLVVDSTEYRLALVIYAVILLGSLISLQQMLVLPVLSIKAYSDRIQITSMQGPVAIQTVVINSNQIGKLTFLDENPYKDMDLGLPYYWRVQVELISKFRIPHRAIAVGAHASAVLIESGTENWLIGVDDAAEVFSELRKIYPERGLYHVQDTTDDAPLIGFRKVRLKHFVAARQPIFIAGFLFLFVWICAYFIGPGSFPMSLDEIPLVLWVVIIAWAVVTVVVLVKNYRDRDYNAEVVVLKAYRDRLELRLRKPYGRKVTISSDQLQGFGTIHVKDGDYSNLPGHIEGFRFARWLGSHYALTIETDKEKYAFDVPHPEEAAEALRKLYNLK